MDTIKDIFRGAMFKDLRPIENKDGLRLGENIRFTKEKGKYIIRFLKGTEEKTRRQYRQRLEEHHLTWEEGPDFTL